MKRKLYIAVLLLGMLSAAQVACSQDQVAVKLSEEQIEALQREIVGYMEEVSNITSLIATGDAPQLKQLRRELQSVDARWQVFNSMEQNDIASTPALMELLAQYKQVYLAADDSLTSGMARCNAVATFGSDETFIIKNIATYQGLMNQAKKYSIIQKTAAQLANVKAQEQLLMQQITAKYNEAVAAAGMSPTLKDKMASLEEKYITIQQMSKEIQACAYKPFLQRIKDYLMSFAAMAVILMFFTMVTARIAAIKKAREMAKKFGSKLNGQQDEIPTI